MGPAVLQVVMIVGLTLHLAAMGMASAAPLVSAALKWRQRRHGDALAGMIGKRLAQQSITWLLGGIGVGLLLVALLWWTGERTFFTALGAIPARRLWFGLAELLFFLGCMVVYVWMWDRQPHRPWLHAGLALLAVTNLAYHFPPLFAAIAVLERQPPASGKELSYLELLQVLGQRETLARVAHFLLASVAIAGTMVLVHAARMLRQQTAGEVVRLAAWGARIALAATALELLTGIYLLFQLPAAERNRLLGGHWLATLMLAAGVVAALSLLHLLLAIAVGETSRRGLWRAVGLLCLVLLLMVGARELARRPSRPGRGPQITATQTNRPFPAAGLPLDFDPDVIFEYSKHLITELDPRWHWKL